MSEHGPSRLQMELELLYAMYPEQVSYIPKACQLKFTHHGSLLQLRLPELYPEYGMPDVIAASDSSKINMRAIAEEAIKDLVLNTHDMAPIPIEPDTVHSLTKRKLAISLTTLSGITKSGYPGILIFSGPASAVNEHLNTLKAEIWLTFRVRFEAKELWQFAHGKGVKEVGTMAEVVEAIELSGGQHSNLVKGTKQKQEFLKAAEIK
ncbi:hypothetical protein GQ44DRAFT_829309 [Phaeosphaeriaceae sp. PMI808]|nr:hypothetical protein GQ44DRAFT_829309 [Phaeosphaeriaceae sp. PMI808]